MLFCCLLIFFQNHVFQNSFRNTIRELNSLDPDQARQNIELDVGPTVFKGHQQMTLLMTLVDKKPTARIFLLVDLRDFFQI